MNRTTALTGAVGEHLVAAGLSGLGFVVGVPRSGSPAFDLLVGDSNWEHTWAIQVKTSTDAHRPRVKRPDTAFWEWDIGWSAPDYVRKSLWYVLVDLRGWPNPGDKMPELYAMHSEVVAEWTQRIKDRKWSRALIRLAEVPGADANLYLGAADYRVGWTALAERLRG